MNDTQKLHKSIVALENLESSIPLSLNERNAITTAISLIEKEKSSEASLQYLMNDINDWTALTFGDAQKNPGIANHLLQEVETELIPLLEIHEDPKDQTVELKAGLIEEYADCFMLLLDSANHFGMEAKDLIEATYNKLEINKKRKWGLPDEKGIINHLEEE